MSKYCNCTSPSCDKCVYDPTCNKRRLELDEAKARWDVVRKLDIDHKECGKGYCGVAARSGGDDCEGPPSRVSETVPDKLIFIAEWYEKGSDLVKKYMLIYYGVDGMCEIKDLINNQRFLKKLKLDTVTLPQLYLGNVLSIYGRQMTLAEYADSCTQQYLEPRRQRAFLLVKPHTARCVGKILQTLEWSGFKFLRVRMAQMDEDLAAKFYDTYAAETFFGRLISQMASGPVVAFLLVGENAIERLQCLAGDVDPAVAKLKDPTSFRSIYGKDFILNAVHVSESPECVERDSAYFFTTCRKVLPRLAPGTALRKCSTCCIIKPHAVKEKLAGRIIDHISRSGFSITAMELFYLDRTHADEFYEVYKTVLAEYSAMTAELSLGPCYALEISGCGEDTATTFREFVGPRDPVLARKLRPESLRARFGNKTVENGVHCTDLCEDAEMELDYFFRTLQMI